MKTISSISEEQRMHIVVIIASIPRRSLDDFKESISALSPEELTHLKKELSFLVNKGQSEYLDAYNSL